MKKQIENYTIETHKSGERVGLVVGGGVTIYFTHNGWAEITRMIEETT